MKLQSVKKHILTISGGKPPTPGQAQHNPLPRHMWLCTYSLHFSPSCLPHVYMYSLRNYSTSCAYHVVLLFSLKSRIFVMHDAHTPNQRDTCQVKVPSRGDCQ